MLLSGEIILLILNMMGSDLDDNRGHFLLSDAVFLSTPYCLPVAVTSSTVVTILIHFSLHTFCRIKS